MSGLSNLEYGDQYDFGAVFSAIKTYYPIDIGTLGQKASPVPHPDAIATLLKDNFFNKKNYSERWSKFRKYLKNELKKPVEETLNPFHPCYSGLVVLEQSKNETPPLTRKELHFTISLLGPFYSIYGLDKSEISLWVEPMAGSQEKRQHPFPAYHAITISPFIEYRDGFLLLEQKIKDYYPSHRLIPYKVGKRKISGISAFREDVNEKLRDSVFAALFNHHLNPDVHPRGDFAYGFEQWLRV